MIMMCSVEMGNLLVNGSQVAICEVLYEDVLSCLWAMNFLHEFVPYFPLM